MTSLPAEIPVSGGDWRDHAACKDQATWRHDPWHPPHEYALDAYEEARQICAGCPVRPDCLAYALDTLEQTGDVRGMFAGLTPGELRKRATQLGRTARKSAQHGTRARYTRGCRCPACTSANRRYEDDRRAARPSRVRAPWEALIAAGEACCGADRCLASDRSIRPGDRWALNRTYGTPVLVHVACHRSIASRHRWAG